MSPVRLFLAALGSLFFLQQSNHLQAQQREFSAQELIDNLLKLEPILKYKTFKKDFEADIASISAQPMSAANYQALQDVYGEIKGQFDAFIGLIKQDILDFKNIKKMAKNEGAFIEKYAKAFNNAATLFNEDYPKVVARINSDNQTRFIGGGLLLELGKMAFEGIVGWIRNKRIDKDELMGDLLQIVNTSFVDKLKMRPFSFIAAPHKPLPNNGSGNNPSPAPIPNNGGNNANGGGNGGKMKKSAPVSDIVEFPATKSLAGSIYLRQPSGEKMLFRSAQARTRDLTIGALNSEQGAKAGVFGSEKAYSAGTQFQVFTQNTGLIYVFAFNSGGSCAPIYPYSAEWVQGFGMKSKMRDLTINPLMLKNEESQILTIPSPRAETGEENYITISGSNSKEQLCIILTKSELDFSAFLQQIQAASGTLAERLTQVLGDYASGYEQVRSENGIIYYDLNQIEQPILPLVFEIMR